MINDVTIRLEIQIGVTYDTATDYSGSHLIAQAILFIKHTYYHDFCGSTFYTKVMSWISSALSLYDLVKIGLTGGSEE